MTGTIVTALPYFSDPAKRIAESISGTFVPYHDSVFTEVIGSADRIVALMATGIVVRKIAPLLTDKWRDPAIVVISPDLKYAIPISGGHHGANDLAYDLEEKLGFIPVITTATESTGRDSAEGIAREKCLRIVNPASTRRSNAAVLEGIAGIYSVEGPGMVIAGSGVSFLVSDAPCTAGIGCRKGTPSHEITDAIDTALQSVSLTRADVSIYATSTLKLHEQGLTEAIREIGGNLIFLDHETLNKESVHSVSAAERFGLPGVAEPAALAVSYKKELIMEKKVYGNVTVAFAR
ncbi:cobalt-precorrin 5A hydrolase [Methanospirillum lacunae]|uniref:Cobalt-precorrin 5A hydrolase n=1 Tax=Methanospirillum lacunae TaxID=668570 RepID=A0A2V2MYL9_9EURY|nr:cobalt-precorrin 5A hydrolase [Methanospirillum lacunae]PWR70506.1 cobalt-precorrin 5A hydrolase [Methanospirillum lacunae]